MAKKAKTIPKQEQKKETEKRTMRKPMCMVKGVVIEERKVYKIKHRKKGDLIIQVLEIVPTEEVDIADDFLLFSRYDVRAGTSQVGLSLAPGKMNIRESALRPSHILAIDELTDASWRIPINKKLAEAQEKEGGPGFFTQILNLVKGGN